MIRALRLAVGCSYLGSLLAVICLARTTPITMTVFFMLGLPCFAVSVLVFMWLVVRALRQLLTGSPPAS